MGKMGYSDDTSVLEKAALQVVAGFQIKMQIRSAGKKGPTLASPAVASRDTEGERDDALTVKVVTMFQGLSTGLTKHLQQRGKGWTSGGGGGSDEAWKYMGESA